MRICGHAFCVLVRTRRHFEQIKKYFYFRLDICIYIYIYNFLFLYIIYNLYLHRGQATSSLHPPPLGWASFAVGLLVAAFDLATDARRLDLRAALGARVRVPASDPSIADANCLPQ